MVFWSVGLNGADRRSPLRRVASSLPASSVGELCEPPPVVRNRRSPLPSKRPQGCSQKFFRKFLILRSDLCFLRVSYVHGLYTFYGQGMRNRARQELS